MSVNLLDLAFFTFGVSLVSRETVVPLLVSQLTSSTVAIGLVSAVYSLALYLPQLVGASVASSMPLKKPFVALWGGLGERLPYLLAGSAVLLRAGPARAVALAAWWVGLVLTREPPSASIHPPTPLSHFLRNLPNVLRRDTNFARFIASIAVMRAATMA